MSGHFTDRDERMWQLRAEERATRPLPVGAWLRGLRASAARVGAGRGAPSRGAAERRGAPPVACEQA
ncbi:MULTISPECIES: hypothetical protein [Streptomyces]|uniref:Uncharacterized protein n=1 Tax=Streptomyces viridochromogenes TaxID=1938 RepID=A0A0L8J0N7_STRVR|nr:MULTISPECIES: hypothetical protein [Streptomyces]KOG07226.1 hypothetical protein ADK34_40650 [Streptomyces viridochromogenes]